MQTSLSNTITSSQQNMNKSINSKTPISEEGAIMGFFSGLFGKKEEEKAATAPTVGGRRKRTAKKRSARKTRKNGRKQ